MAMEMEPLDRPIPVLVNDSDDSQMYIYRHAAKDMWILRNKLTPDKPNCNACIVSEFGPLPVGKRTWKLSPTAVGKPKGECTRVCIMLYMMVWTRCSWPVVHRIGVCGHGADSGAPEDGACCCSHAAT